MWRRDSRHFAALITVQMWHFAQRLHMLPPLLEENEWHVLSMMLQETIPVLVEVVLKQPIRRPVRNLRHPMSNPTKRYEKNAASIFPTESFEAGDAGPREPVHTNTPRRQPRLMLPRTSAAGKGDLLPVVGRGL